MLPAVFFAWFGVVGVVKICLLNTRERLVRLTTAPHMHLSQSGACTPSLPPSTDYSVPLAHSLAVSGDAGLHAPRSKPLPRGCFHVAFCKL
jgi:hypothetical protein